MFCRYLVAFGQRRLTSSWTLREFSYVPSISADRLCLIKHVVAQELVPNSAQKKAFFQKMLSMLLSGLQDIIMVLAFSRSGNKMLQIEADIVSDVLSESICASHAYSSYLCPTAGTHCDNLLAR